MNMLMLMHITVALLMLASVLHQGMQLLEWLQ